MGSSLRLFYFTLWDQETKNQKLDPVSVEGLIYHKGKGNGFSEYYPFVISRAECIGGEEWSFLLKEMPNDVAVETS